MKEVNIVGGGLAGCEAAWFLAKKGYKINLYEMRPEVTTPAHVSSSLAELVCSNSLKSFNMDTAAGLLKKELEFFGSLLMDIAAKTAVPAGAALAVDREKFALLATEFMEGCGNINVIRKEIKELALGENTILACGPLASPAICDEILKLTGGEGLWFVDAISPVIAAESINMDKGYFAGRYGKGGDDYLNLPMTEHEFNEFFNALLSAEVVVPHGFEDEVVFERCMPIEVIASRGIQTLLFGPMRPVGLEHPVTGERPFAVVQLRTENKDKTAYNIVGFQTKMKIPFQKEVFRLIPGLENAEFLRYGTIHRNTYIDSPSALNINQSFKVRPELFIAGQITGVEGYLESMASGIMAAVQMDRYLRGAEPAVFDVVTAFGALQRHISGEFGTKNYSPGNFHFGMLPPLEERVRKKSDRKLLYGKRAIDLYLSGYIESVL